MRGARNLCKCAGRIINLPTQKRHQALHLEVWRHQHHTYTAFVISPHSQKPGAYTAPHFHGDDALGAIFYVDAPPGRHTCTVRTYARTPVHICVYPQHWLTHVSCILGSTRFCYDDATGTPQRARWEQLDPLMVRSLHSQGRGHVEPEAGDLVVMPAGWLRHWVPPIRGDAVRTVVVLNMVCL